MKSVLMDIVVADIPPKFGMLLSRVFTKRLGGSLQNDLSYASIPIFGGQLMRLYREHQFAYIVSSPQNPINHPVYAVPQSMDSCILHINDDYSAPALKQTRFLEEQEANDNELLWRMFFDGSSSKEGAGAGIILVSPDNHIFPFPYKLEFETTNNIAEYEALILGLKAAKDLNVKKLEVIGDSELVVL